MVTTERLRVKDKEKERIKVNIRKWTGEIGQSINE